MSWCETECKKNVPLVKQNFEVFILRQRTDQKRKKGWGKREKERGLRKGAERDREKRDKRELS